MAPNLNELVRNIVVPANEESDVRYYVEPVNGFENHFFGRTNAGHPCLLLGTSHNFFRSPVRLSSIQVNYAVPCNIKFGDGAEQVERLTVISCTDVDRVMQGYFTHVCETLLRIVGKCPDLQSIIDAVAHLVDLFQKLSRPARKSVVGLFAELFVIDSASDSIAAVKAWRSAIDDRFDFSVDNVRLEVKASGTRLRAHNFSLEQCTPPIDTCSLLISLFVESSGGGTSLFDLIERIEGKIRGDTDMILKFQETVTEGLGDNASVSLSMRFDANVARSSLKIYDLETIPRVPDPLPTTVSQVRFRSDLSRVPTASVRSQMARNERLRHILPDWA